MLEMIKPKIISPDYYYNQPVCLWIPPHIDQNDTLSDENHFIVETLKRFLKESLGGSWSEVMTELFLVSEQTKS